ncbi:MAG: AtpZ/AtpI family protein [Chloroflexota bacterium]|nr:AtpZ/AtpI family protein [Chloroflexota bacterium]
MAYSDEDYSEEEIPEMLENPQSPKLWRKGDSQDGIHLLAQVSTIAWNLAVPIVGGVILGDFIDNRIQSGSTWTISLLALGVMVAFTNLYSLYIEHGGRKDSAKANSGDVSGKENHETKE